MYKPGTQLIIDTLCAAAAAHEQGFEVESSTRAHTVPGLIGESIWVRRFMEKADKWRITVTESGPNAAERFLPQLDDAVNLKDGVLRLTGEIDENTYYSLCGDFWPLSEVKRIIERNGAPFPQFSEVIEP